MFNHIASEKNVNLAKHIEDARKLYVSESLEFIEPRKLDFLTWVSWLFKLIKGMPQP